MMLIYGVDTVGTLLKLLQMLEEGLVPTEVVLIGEEEGLVILDMLVQQIMSL